VRIGFAVLILALLAGVVVGREKPVEEIIGNKIQTEDFNLAQIGRRESP